ncbi:hypothetical protein ACFQ9Z_36610 [Streptomyces sp. NPDC056580]|uniref:hypothetical protein n=1 Tax=Streptomyces sp. NPDC056580 TaxID=3345872 RepID=UPI0036868253
MASLPAEAPRTHRTVFEFTVDYEGDLCISYRADPRDDFPDSSELPEGACRYEEGVYLELANAADGLDALAERSAAAIRTIIGSHPSPRPWPHGRR